MNEIYGYLELSLPDRSQQKYEQSKSENNLGWGLANDIMI